jgi:hypothetical protein
MIQLTTVRLNVLESSRPYSDLQGTSCINGYVLPQVSVTLVNTKFELILM